MNIDPLAIVGCLIVVTLALILYRLHRRPENGVNMTDALMENGHVSRQALLEIGSWIAMTWVLVHQEFHNVLTDWYVMLYGGFWISKSLLRVFKGPTTQIQNGEVK